MNAARYRDDPEAIRALVQPDRVHRDLYIDPDLFALEQEVPGPSGDLEEIAGKPADMPCKGLEAL